MSDSEIKPSFTGKYMLLTGITALIVAAVSTLIPKIYEKREVRQLSYLLGPNSHEISGKPLFGEQISTVYHLKGAPEKPLKTLIRKSILIQNTGTKAAEDILFSVSIKEDKASLIDKPGMRTVPPNIFDAIKVTRDADSNYQKHLWTISLLNPGESISFEYGVFSEAELQEVAVNAIVRKPDWDVAETTKLTIQEKGKVPTLLILFIATIVGMLFSLLAGVFVQYSKAWISHPNPMSIYPSFWQFWCKGWPQELKTGNTKKTTGEQDDADQPATDPASKPESESKIEPDSDGRSQ